MANHIDINKTQVVSPEGVKFVAVKNGKFVQCELSSLLKKVNEEYPAAVNASISKLDEAQNKAIAEMNKKLDDILAKYQAATSEIEALKLSIAKLEDILSKQEVTEETGTKATKKTKKSAE